MGGEEKGKQLIFFTVNCILVILGGMMVLENHQWIPKHGADSLMRKGVSDGFRGSL